MSQSGEKRSVFLDVDPSIIEKNMTIVKDSSIEDGLKNLFPSPSINAVVVQPSPGFCVKTKIPEENKKIFINICHTDAIPPPDDINEDELVKILSSEEPSDYRVPMSIGEARTEKDKSGQPSTVYDVAISTIFFKKLQSSKVFHTFFMNIVFEGLQNKYGFVLEITDYVILKNRINIGNLQTHRIQKRISEQITNTKDAYKPLIEIISSSNDTDAPKKAIPKKPLEIEYQLIREPGEGKIEYLIGEFRINDKLRADDVLLDIGVDRIIVETPKTRQLTDVFVPFSIRQNSVKAVLNMNNNVLIVTMAASDP
ncbi:PIH1 domain containing 1 [Arctopsyche grandis]|uniref:PIH1 domain containing 1 n=1 Tax=Arctopsyche grandis TaxID=121162 RepID=UPI00406D803E